MTTLTLDQVGVLQGVTTTDPLEARANFDIQLRSEVQLAYNNTLTVAPLFLNHTLKKGTKAHRFPFTGRADAAYHVKGKLVEDTQQSVVGYRAIEADELMISSTFVDVLDDFMEYEHIRSDQVNQMGYAIANKVDNLVALAAFKSARSANALAGEVGGATLVNASVNTNALILLDMIRSGNDLFDVNNVPSDGRFVLLKAAQWRLLQSDKDLQNTLFGGSGGWISGEMGDIDGTRLVKTKNMPTGVVTNEAGFQFNDYAGDYTNTVAGMFHSSAAGSVTALELDTQMSKADGDYEMMAQGSRIVVRKASGAGALRSEGAIEFKTAA